MTEKQEFFWCVFFMVAMLAAIASWLEWEMVATVCRTFVYMVIGGISVMTFGMILFSIFFDQK